MIATIDGRPAHLPLRAFVIATGKVGGDFELSCRLNNHGPRGSPGSEAADKPDVPYADCAANKLGRPPVTPQTKRLRRVANRC